MTTFQIDATNQSLGRIATQIATALRGKHLPSYAPEKLANTEVVISNLKSAKFTGNKLEQKTYFHYSGYHGGIRLAISAKNGKILKRCCARLFIECCLK